MGREEKQAQLSPISVREQNAEWRICLIKKEIMKMKKTLFLLSLLALFVLAGCTETKEEIVFGAVLPLSGSNAFYGDFTRYGFDLAVEDINAKGGIDGKPLRIIYEDTAGEKQQAVSAAQKLINIDQVDALLTVTTPMGGALAPVAEENGIPMIYASSTNSFAEGKTYVFKDYPDAGDICELLMKSALENGHEKVALFGTDAEFTHLCKEGAEKVGELVTYENYAFGDVDFRVQFTKIKEAEATALITSAFSNDCLNVFKYMRELGVTPTLYIPFQQFGCGSSKGTEAGIDLMEDAYGGDVALEATSTEPMFVAFKQRLEVKEWDLSPVGSALMYDSFTVLANAYEGCEDKVCAADNLRALKDHKGVAGTLSFDGKQTVTRELMLTHFDGETWVKVK